MMDLARDVQEQIRRFVVGFVSAHDLSDWLDQQAQEIHDAGDPPLRRLTDLTFSVLEDVFQGQRTIDQARVVLQVQVSPTVSVIGHVVQAVQTMPEGYLVATVNHRVDFAPVWTPITTPLTHAH